VKQGALEVYLPGDCRTGVANGGACESRGRSCGRLTAGGLAGPSLEVRRGVWERDGGRCGFVGEGGRCAEQDFLEFHHVVPHAAGGPATVDNIQLRCRAHNAYESEQAHRRLELPAEAWHDPTPDAYNGA